MKRLTVMALFVMFCVATAGAVPGMINFQGQVESGGTPFDDTGYFKFAIVNVDGTTTYWSNDGTSGAGSEPTDAVAIGVTGGLYSVILGQGMDPLDGAVFDNDDLYLRVWFDDGTIGSQLLTPDQRFTSMGFAVRAATADDAGSVGGQEYSSTWDTTLANIQTAVSGDFHNLGGTDAVDDADADPTNEIQNFSEVLTQGNDAGGVDAVNLGNVGIGVASPTNPLHVSSDARIGDPGSGGEGTSQGASDWTGAGYIETPWVYANAIEASDERGGAGTLITVGTSNYTDSDQIALVTDGDPRVFVNKQGNVGINKTLPSATLDLVGTLRTSSEPAEYLDQENDGSPQNAVGISHLWQSFTPALDGQLTKVAIYVYNYPSTASFNLEIYEGQGTGGTLLGSEQFSFSGATGWNTFVFTTSIILTAETEYTMNFDNFPYTAFRVTMYDQYTRGMTSLSDPEDDFLFRAYIWGPEAILKVGTETNGVSIENSYDLSVSGDVGIGTTSPNYRFHVKDSTSGYVALFENPRNDSDSNGIKIRAGDDTYSARSDFIMFRRPDDTTIGRVEQNSSTSVSYSTTSDQRLKSDIQSTEYGLTDLMNVEVVDYTYKDDPDIAQTGFLAQQLYEHFPEAVSPGGNDPKEDPWMIDYGRVTPLLVKAVQELTERTERLEEELGMAEEYARELEGQTTEQEESLAAQKAINQQLMMLIQELRDRIERIEGSN